MKKALLFLSCILILSSSCKKNNDDSPSTYTQDKLNGVWESVEKFNDCTIQLTITASSLTELAICDDGDATQELDSYLFDGYKISGTMSGIPVEFVIGELTDTKLVLTWKMNGMTIGTFEYTKKK